MIAIMQFTKEFNQDMKVFEFSEVATSIIDHQNSFLLKGCIGYHLRHNTTISACRPLFDPLPDFIIEAIDKAPKTLQPSMEPSVTDSLFTCSENQQHQPRSRQVNKLYSESGLNDTSEQVQYQYEDETKKNRRLRPQSSKVAQQTMYSNQGGRQPQSNVKSQRNININFKSNQANINTKVFPIQNQYKATNEIIQKFKEIHSSRSKKIALNTYEKNFIKIVAYKEIPCRPRSAQRKLAGNSRPVFLTGNESLRNYPTAVKNDNPSEHNTQNTNLKARKLTRKSSIEDDFLNSILKQKISEQKQFVKKNTQTSVSKDTPSHFPFSVSHNSGYPTYY